MAPGANYSNRGAKRFVNAFQGVGACGCLDWGEPTPGGAFSVVGGLPFGCTGVPARKSSAPAKSGRRTPGCDACAPGGRRHATLRVGDSPRLSSGGFTFGLVMPNPLFRQTFWS